MIKIFTSLLFIVIALTAFSQNFRLGFQASPQISWMSSDKAGILNYKVQPGIKYGVEADIFMAGSPRYCLNSGLFVASHSFTGQYSLTEPFTLNLSTFNNKVLIRYKLNYLEIPLIIKLKSDQFYRSTYYGQFGLSNQFNLSATAFSSDYQLAGDNVNKHITMYNAAMVVGGGMEYDVAGNTALNIGLQYTNGFVDITRINKLVEKTTFQTLRIVFGVMF
jgi:hypothetical protein